MKVDSALIINELKSIDSHTNKPKLQISKVYNTHTEGPLTRPISVVDSALAGIRSTVGENDAVMFA